MDLGIKTKGNSYNLGDAVFLSSFCTHLHYSKHTDKSRQLYPNTLLVLFFTSVLADCLYGSYSKKDLISM